MSIQDLLTKQLLFELIKNISPEVSEHITTLIEDCKHKTNQNRTFFYIKALLFNVYDKPSVIVLKTNIIEYILELDETNMLNANGVTLIANYLYKEYNQCFIPLI